MDVIFEGLEIRVIELDLSPSLNKIDKAKGFILKLSLGSSGLLFLFLLGLDVEVNGCDECVGVEGFDLIDWRPPFQ